MRTARAVIEVDDPLAQPPQVREDAKVDDEGGRGLVLVELFSHSWGYYTTAIGKCVWASFTRYRMPRRTEYFQGYIKAYKHRRRQRLIDMLGGS
jgi:hypothetical protein